MKLKVQKIESIRDLDGNLGKKIELVEERDGISPFMVGPRTEEAQIARDVMRTMQIVVPHVYPPGMKIILPKIILFLTEQEYDSLGVTFAVNQIYEITLGNQGFKFQKETTE